MRTIAISVALFVVAGLLEIGGGYMIWLWLRERWAWWLALVGAGLLVIYAAVHTLQPAHFGRVYAAYGGMFIVLSLLWGWGIDGRAPDRWDTIGAGLCLVGVLVMMYMPRSAGAGLLP